jgi:hypothetical protein
METLNAEQAARITALLSSLSPDDAAELADSLRKTAAATSVPLPPDVLAAIEKRAACQSERRQPLSVRRLACAGLEPFLVDIDDGPPVSGRLPRRILASWWVAAEHCADDRMRFLEDKLRALGDEPAPAEIDPIGEDARRSAAAWTRKLLQVIDKKPRPEWAEVLADPVERGRVVFIADSLEVAEALRPRLAAIPSSMPEFEPGDVEVVKQEYNRLAPACPKGVPFFALAVMNRLPRQWQILRLPGALFGRCAEPLLRASSLVVLGHRLFHILQHSAETLQKLLHGKTIASEIDAVRLHKELDRFLDYVQGISANLEMPSGSGWSGAMTKVLGIAHAAIARHHIDLLAEIVSGYTQDPMPPGVAPLETALAAANILRDLAARMPIYGKAEQEAVDRLGAALAAHLKHLVARARTEQKGAALARTIEAGLSLVRALYPQDRATLVLRAIL